MKDISIRFSGLLTTLLTVLFIGLKLTNYINWSWLWVLSPLWIPMVLIILLVLLIGVVYCLKG
jgi:hypothetical protein